MSSQLQSKFLLLALLILICSSTIPGEAGSHPKNSPNKTDTDWPVYGGTAENNHYSPLNQIDRNSVKHLRVAWTFDTGEAGGLQTSPIEVGGILYGLTPSQRVFAMNAATGSIIWEFESRIKATQPNRGLALWTSGLDTRILVGIMNYLYALDASSGLPVPSFGKGGRIDLREDLGRDPSTQAIYLTTPPLVYRDLAIVGGRVSETLPSSPGDVRAYDIRTGKLRWTFHTIPRSTEIGYDTWPKDAWKTSGGANNWAGMTLDTRRGIVYVPTGSAAFDFYGGDRIGDNLFASSLLALDAESGERIWHFQGVHHDLWDRDFPSPPILLAVKREGQNVDAVAEASKQGFVFLFERDTGKPLFPIECKKYPPSDVPGEQAAAQQCLPTKPAPFARQRLTEDLLTPRTPEAHQWALDRFHTFRSDGPFVPFSTDKETVVFPGFDGGAEWGGQAVDPVTSIFYVNANDLAWTGQLAETSSGKDADNPSSAIPVPAMKYRLTGYQRFYDPDGYPATAPPWGTLNAINMNTGEYVWKIPLGEYPELLAKGMKNTGTENYGGPIVTAGGLVFIGATNYDKKLRAFDKATGELLWETVLPFAGNATPITYEIKGRQYLVIAAGGGKDPKSKSGGVYVAFAVK